MGHERLVVPAGFLRDRSLIPASMVRNDGVAHFLLAPKWMLGPPKAAFPSPAQDERQRMRRPVSIGCRVVGKERDPVAFLRIDKVYPIDDDVVLDLIPTLKKRVHVLATADVEGGVLVEMILIERYREKGL